MPPPNSSVPAVEAASPAFAQDGGSLPNLTDLFAAFNNLTPLALAVSGGSDSMALLHLVQRWAENHAPDVQLHVLTVDHQLRASSTGEAQQVARWCSELGVAHTTLCWSGAKPATGIQAKARAARYDLMSAWCRANGFDVLATAHTRNDQAETVLMRQQRTSSPKSLAGIWPETVWNGIRVVRPFLNMHRKDLRQALRHMGASWFDDPSNDDERFERVRLRKLLASDAQIAALAEIADGARRETLRLDGLRKDWVARHCAIAPTGLITMQRLSLCDVDDALAGEILGWCLAAAGGGAKHPEAASIRRLRDACRRLDSGKRTLGGAIIAIRKRSILIGREPGRILPTPIVIGRQGYVDWDGRFRITGPHGTMIRPALGLRPRSASELPAFVVSSLPVYEDLTGAVVFPHFEAAGAVTVELCEGFRD